MLKATCQSLPGTNKPCKLKGAAEINTGHQQHQHEAWNTHWHQQCFASATAPTDAAVCCEAIELSMYMMKEGVSLLKH